MLSLYRVQEALAIVALVLVIAGLVGAYRKRLRFVVTNRSDRTEYSLEWGMSAEERQTEGLRILARLRKQAARKVAQAR